MSRPLLVTDCDEVLLHMLRHFRDWLSDAHDLDFAFHTHSFAETVRDRKSGQPISVDEIWPLLDSFFESEMHRQNVVPGAVDALQKISEVADIVILTNIGNQYEANRVAQLEAVDIRHRVLCNRGGKGPPLLELIDALKPGVTAFVDDLPIHHESVANHAPFVWRLHMIAEPEIAPGIPAAPHAHARIDDWAIAKDWILERFSEGPAKA